MPRKEPESHDDSVAELVEFQLQAAVDRHARGLQREKEDCHGNEQLVEACRPRRGRRSGCHEIAPPGAARATRQRGAVKEDQEVEEDRVGEEIPKESSLASAVLKMMSHELSENQINLVEINIKCRLLVS